MFELTKLQGIKLEGEIAEVYQKNGQSFVKIFLNPCLLELTLDSIPDVQLGDAVEVDARLVIDSLKSV